MRKRTQRLAAAALVTAVGIGAVIGVGAQADPPSAATLSARLKAEPTLDFNDRSGLIVDEARVRARASELAADVPLPPGGSFDDIQWQNIGGASDTQIKSFLQANASCDWYRYALSQRPTGETLALIRDIPEWSGVRGRDIRGPALSIVGELARGSQDALKSLANGACVGRPDGYPLPPELRGPQGQ